MAYQQDELLDSMPLVVDPVSEQASPRNDQSQFEWLGLNSSTKHQYKIFVQTYMVYTVYIYMYTYVCMYIYIYMPPPTSNILGTCSAWMHAFL